MSQIAFVMQMNNIFDEKEIQLTNFFFWWNLIGSPEPILIPDVRVSWNSIQWNLWWFTNYLSMIFDDVSDMKNIFPPTILSAKYVRIAISSFLSIQSFHVFILSFDRECPIEFMKTEVNWTIGKGEFLQKMSRLHWGTRSKPLCCCPIKNDQISLVIVDRPVLWWVNVTTQCKTLNKWFHRF
jgi:hypothetical protein